MSRVAVVTGSNKGIGYAIVRTLCKSYPEWTVYLTARDESRGYAAIEQLKKEGVATDGLRFHPLDIGDDGSRRQMARYLNETHDGLDVLVNNAAIAFKQAATEPFAEQASVTCRTNYYDTLALCDELFPLLRPHARVVNVTSRAANFTWAKMGESARARFQACQSVGDVTAIVDDFVASAQRGDHEEKGFPPSAYGMSKLALTVASMLQHQKLAKDARGDLVLNCCCPGYVITDMTSQKGNKSIDEGADTPVFLATLKENVIEPRGQFVAERKIISYTDVVKL